MPAMPDEQQVDHCLSQSQEKGYNCGIEVPLFPQAKRCHTEDGKPLVVDIGIKCKESKEEFTELEKALYRIEHNGTVYISIDDIPCIQNVCFRKPVTITEDTFDDGEQPEKGSELTVHLDVLDYSEKKPTVPTSKQSNELQNVKDSTIDQSSVCITTTEKDMEVLHKQSSLVTAAPTFSCPPALRESFTLNPSYVDNRHTSESNPVTTNSRQVNSESQSKHVSLEKHKAIGRTVAGGSPQNSKGGRSQQQKQEQQKQQKEKQPTTGGDSGGVSGSGDAGDERRGDDDDERRRYDGDGRNYKSSAQGGGEELDEEVEEKKTDTEEKVEEEQKDVEIGTEQQEELNCPAYILKCLKADIEYKRNKKNGISLQQTEFTIRGDCFLKHLQHCRLECTVCENCRVYIHALHDLVSSTPSAFPFYEEYQRASNSEERHQILLIWLNERSPEKNLEVEACCENLKRMRFSSGQGARPKKKFKQAGSSSKAVAMETTPSPDLDLVGSSMFSHARAGHVLNRQPAGVIYGDQETCREKIFDWIQNHDTTDGEINDGVIFKRELTPRDCYYRPGEEFHKIRPLGSGSFGDVFLCYDEKTKKEFVCKFVPTKDFEVNEVLIWMRLKHQHIVPLWGVVRHGNNILMISEYIPCRPLSARNDELPRSDLNIVKWIKQLLCVLEYIHSMKIVHMDIKPANILLTYDSDIVLIDWGLAMELNNNGQQIVSSPRGTAQFMAPEVCRCETFNATIDIWSTICLAINLFTGSPPWMKRFPGLPSYVYLVGTKPPPVEDIPVSLDPAIRGFLVEGFGDNDTRPTASNLLRHPMFDLDNVRRYTTSLYEDVDEGLEDLEMDTERFPINPPDSLGDLDTSCILKPLRPEANPHAGDVGDCEINQMSSAQQVQMSPAQGYNCCGDGFQWLDNRNFLQLLGQASTPSTARPRDLPLPEGHCTQGGSPELDDVTIKLSNLDVNDEQLDDDEDLYGPGPETEPEPEPYPEPSDNPGLAATPRSSDGSLQCGTSGSTGTPLVTPDRRSSSQSSVFGELFRCLPSTPDYEPTASASAASYRKQQSFTDSSQQLSYLESLYSELNFPTDHFQAEVQLKIESITSGIGTTSGNQLGNLPIQDIRKPVPRSRTESQSSGNSLGTSIYIQVFDKQIRVANCATMTYGELAKGISSKVFGIFAENNIPNVKFVLQDQAGNTFDVYDKVDPTCEILVVEASQDGKWKWCISPEGLEDKH